MSSILTWSSTPFFERSGLIILLGTDVRWVLSS